MISLKKYGIDFEGPLKDACGLDIKKVPSVHDERGFANSMEFQLKGQSFKGGALVQQGRYGSVHKWIVGEDLLFEKRPHKEGTNLLPEACLQIEARKCLATTGCEQSISEVRYIIRRGPTVSFMMVPFINVLSVEDALDFVYSSGINGAQFDSWFISIFCQIVLLLGYLEDNLRLNHRDLKGDNILISMKPSRQQKAIRVASHLWKLNYDHEVKIVDFGFACNGIEMNSPATISVGNTFPAFEWCPKEGRDIYFLLCYFYGQTTFRRACSSRLLRKIEGWIHVDKVLDALRLYGLSRLDWISFLVNTSRFDCSKCSSAEILEFVSSEWSSIIHKEDK
jgi:serine/threonine protein kinase